MKRASNTEVTDKADVAKHFTSVADVYNRRNYVLAGKRGKYPDIAIRHQYFLEMLEGTHGRVLEVGCGSGQMLCDLLLRGYEVVGLDLATGMLEASRRLIDERVPGARAELMLGDVEKLSFPDASFDVFLAAGVIEYLASDEKCLREISRVLKPGGTVLLSVRNRTNLSRPLVTSRDLLRSVPFLGPAMDATWNGICTLLSMPPDKSFPGRRHAPRQLERAMREVGLEPTDHSFCHFTVLPRFLERRFPEFSVGVEQRFEVFRRSRLGYFANMYIVKATKIR